MLIPYYWADARLQTKSKSRQITVKRWGWSDVSQEDAQAVAVQRAREAIERIQQGEKLPRLEAQRSYEIPIREEVVSRHGKIAITRNIYGSLCLNTPNVFFADVDTEWRGDSAIPVTGCLLMILAGVAIGFWQKSFWLGAGITLVTYFVCAEILSMICARQRPQEEAKLKQERLDTIRAFVVRNTHWHLRIYETPAGYRLLAMHDVFDPRSESTKAALKELHCDERFSTLCALQACFRARVSPKHWRTGYKPEEPLPKSKWPFPSDHLSRRQTWISGYEKEASHFASCRFLERIGSQTIHPDAEEVRELHDQLCQAESTLPLA